MFINYLFWSGRMAFLGTGICGWLCFVGVWLRVYTILLERSLCAHLRSKALADIIDQRVIFVSQAVQGTQVMKMSGYERWHFGGRSRLFRSQTENDIGALQEYLMKHCGISEWSVLSNCA
jgi:hypothetical protein